MTANNSRPLNVTNTGSMIGSLVFTMVALTSIMFALGCGDSRGATDAVTPVARRDTPSLVAPLNDADIRMFLEVVSQLPDGKTPEFEPLTRSMIDDRLPAETLVSAYRREYRRMFDPVEQGSRWRRDRQLTETLLTHGTDPEQFAALMTRIGCAVAANTVSSRFNLQEASAKADMQLAAIVSQINTLDSRAALAPGSPIAVNQRRQPLVDQLKALVALSEFSTVLLSVPPESRSVIAEHKDALAVHLPRSGELKLFERTLDAPAVIVPISHETAAPR